MTVYANLIGTKGILINDLQVGIEFPGKVTDFARKVIEEHENKAMIEKIISMEQGSPMQIKILDKSEKNKKTSKKEPTNIYYVTAREEKNKKVGWEVKRGSAAKVSAFLKTKEEALEKVRELARNSEATVMIYRADGSLQDTITFNKK